jgi:hypothetical protein
LIAAWIHGYQRPEEIVSIVAPPVRFGGVNAGRN